MTRQKHAFACEALNIKRALSIAEESSKSLVAFLGFPVATSHLLRLRYATIAWRQTAAILPLAIPASEL